MVIRATGPGAPKVLVNTVNTHIRNIYAKLQAQDRFSAVRRAREMRLLSAGLQLDR
jgi:LuxR family maltose regulon positive regulatory protein